MARPLKPKVIECRENDVNADRPKTVGELGIERIIGRSIIGWEDSLGSYGMGGPGFFGLRLQSCGDYEKEWLVLRVWDASRFLYLDNDHIKEWFSGDIPFGRLFAVLSSKGGNVLTRTISILFPKYASLYRKLYRPFWSKLGKRLVGSIISDAQMGSEKTLIRIQKGPHIHEITFCSPLVNADRHEEAWIITTSGRLLM